MTTTSPTTSRLSTPPSSPQPTTTSKSSTIIKISTCESILDRWSATNNDNARFKCFRCNNDYSCNHRYGSWLSRILLVLLSLSLLSTNDLYRTSSGSNTRLSVFQFSLLLTGVTAADENEIRAAVAATARRNQSKDWIQHHDEHHHDPMRMMTLTTLYNSDKNHRILQQNDVTNNTNCTYCTNGGGGTIISNPDKVSFCELIRYNIASTPYDSNDCYTSQLLTHQYCGCYTYPKTMFCNICNTNTSSPAVVLSTTNQQKMIPSTFLIPIVKRNIFSNNNDVNTMTTCEDILFSNRQEEYEVQAQQLDTMNTTKTSVCNYNSRAAWYCGCPNAVDERKEPSNNGCYLCTSNSLYQNNGIISISRTKSSSIVSAEELPPWAVIPDTNSNNDTYFYYPDRKVPPTFRMNCQDLDDAGSLFTSSTNDIGPTCDLLLADLPIDAKSYCGCRYRLLTDTPTNNSSNNNTNTTDDAPLPPMTNNNTTTNTNCTLCPMSVSTYLLDNADTIVLTQPQLNGITCKELDIVMPYVIDDTYCSSMKQLYSYQCCSGVTASPVTAAPITMQPTRSPTIEPLLPPEPINNNNTNNSSNIVPILGNDNDKLTSSATRTRMTTINANNSIISIAGGIMMMLFVQLI